eukprot:COSAG02_NODE_733_length_17960_cov_122.222440_8_plen_74_part_00
MCHVVVVAGAVFPLSFVLHGWAYSSHATGVSLPREGTHGVVGVSWHGRVCGRGSRGMVVVVHGLGGYAIVVRR